MSGWFLPVWCAGILVLCNPAGYCETPTAATPHQPATLENSLLRVTVSGATGCCEVLEKQTGTRWTCDPVDGAAGELILRHRETRRPIMLRLGRHSRVTLQRRSASAVTLVFDAFVTPDGESLPGVRVTTRLTLHPDRPEIRLEVIDAAAGRDREMVSLQYPLRVGALETGRDEGYLVAPYRIGCIVPSGRFQQKVRKFAFQDDVAWSARAHLDIPYHGYSGLTMPWYGAVKGTSAFVAIIETIDDFRMDFLLNYNLQDRFYATDQRSPYPRMLVGSPIWMNTLGSFGYPRAVSYRFLPHGDYVDMAKTYRQYLREQGAFKSLTEKIRDNPNVEKLFGAPLFNLIAWGYPWYTDYTAYRRTWRDIEAFAEFLHDAGLERAFIQTWGGYAELPPQSLPFDPKLGSLDDLRSMVRTIQEEYGYLYSSYHGYPALLEQEEVWRPEEAIRDRNHTMTAWRWGRRCSSFYLETARDNLPETIAVTGQQADYQDMLPHSGGECYDARHPGHPLSRRQNRHNILDVLRYVRELGLVSGVETCMGWSVPHVDYAKGAEAGGPSLFGVFAVPLFGLVYHDAVVTYGWTGSQEAHLRHLAYGVLPWLGPVAEFEKPYIGELLPFLRFQRETALDEMTDHTYLTDALNVQRTRYASGAEVILNNSGRAYPAESGAAVPAGGVWLRFPDGTTHTASTNARWPVSRE